MSDANLKDLDYLKELFADLVAGRIPDTETMRDSRQALNRLDTSLRKKQAIKRYIPFSHTCGNQPYGYMREDDAGEYVRYEDMKQTVALATQYTLTRTLGTLISKKLQDQIDAEVRKFWQAMETIK